MATNSDGSIVLTVEIDTDGLKGEISKLNDTIKSGVNGFKSLGSTVNNFNNTANTTNNTLNTTNNTLNQTSRRITIVNQTINNTTTNAIRMSSALVNNTTNIGRFRDTVNRTGTALADFARQLGIVFSISQLIRFSDEASKLAAQSDANIKRLSMLYGEATQYVRDFASANASAFGMSKTAAYEAAADYGNLFTTFADGAESAKLTMEMLQATTVIASQTGRTYEDVFEKIRSGLYGQTRAIDDLGLSVRQASLMQTQAFQMVSGGVKNWNELTDAELQQIRALAIVEQSQIKYGNTVMQSTALVRSQYNAAFEDFKATWGAVINNVLVPVLSAITTIFNALTALMSGISKLTSFGKKGKKNDIAKNVQTIKADTGGVAANLGKAANSQKKLNKEVKKTLAGFDELEILSDNTADNVDASAGGGAGGGISGGGLQDLGEESGGAGGEPPDYVTPWQSILSSLMAIAAVSLIAIGLILLFMGNIPWGIGFIVGGAALFAITAFSVSAADFSQLGTLLTTLVAITGIILITIGIILLWLGNIPWGIGFIVAGGAMIAVSMWAMLSKMNTEEILATISNIAAFAAGALIAIGIMLLWLGCIPWGIGFIVAGAVSLAISLIALSQMDEKSIQDMLSRLMLIAAGALLALGILMIALVGPTPLAIGLIVAGAAGLVAAVAINSTATQNAVSNFLKENQALIVGIGLAMLVLGIILCVTGVGIPIGIALIVAGAGALVTEVALNWEAIKEKISEFIHGLIEFLKVAAKLVIGVLLMATGIGFPFGMALILSGIGDITGSSETLDWKAIGNKIGEVFDEVKDWLKTWGLLVLGVILCASGVGLPLGIALIKEGGANLTEAQDPLWTAITDKVKEVWGNIKDFWKDNIAKYFTAKWWGDLGKKAISGLLKNVIGGLNKLINAVNKFGFDLPDVLGGGHIGFNIPTIPIPPLAKGAVLPANQPFLAVVGDQKRGTNIEAPADLIKQKAMEAIIEANASIQPQQQVREEHYYLDQTELMSIVYKLFKGGERLNGQSLINSTGGLL